MKKILLVGKLFVIKLPYTDTYGDRLLPMLHIIPDIEENPEDVGYLIPITEFHHATGFCLDRDIMYGRLVDCLKDLEKEYNIFKVDEAIIRPSGIIHLSRTLHRIRTWEVKDVRNLAHELVGIGLRESESLEEFTRAGYPLVYQYIADSKLKKMKLLTSDNYEETEAKIMPKMKDYKFLFGNIRIYSTPLEEIFRREEKETLIYPKYYIIDANPDEKDSDRKEYVAGKKMFIQSVITTKSPRRAIKFFSEEVAEEWAVKNLETFKSGGFEIREILTGGQIHHKYKTTTVCMDSVFDYD